MRSLQEVSFRLRQEAANAFLYVFAPRHGELRAVSPLDVLPNPRTVADVLSQSQYQADLVAVADRILKGKIPIFSGEVDYGGSIAWRRDPLRGTETPLKYFRLIQYLDLETAGDHKLIWEVNRHQFLVLLAQAYALTKEDKYFDAVVAQLDDWWLNNPFQRGINWASALEVAFRSLSWIWLWHLLGSKMARPFTQRFLSELYRHGLHLQYNLSLYFSPNTHLLGEAVALHALGRLFPDWPSAAAWRTIGRDVVRDHMKSKVKQDGSYYEQSSYYQVYALDMFLFHALLEDVTPEYRHGLERMTDFLAALVMPDGRLPFLGDDDGGRFFYPFGERTKFAAATLAAASVFLGTTYFAYSKRDVQEIALWWLGPNKCGGAAAMHPIESRVFAESGIVTMRRRDVGLLFDAGSFGPGNAGHSHADALSFVVWKGTEEILIDSGTYAYMDPEWREAFRATAAHNTIRIDARDQALSSGPFRWIEKAEVRLIEFSSTAEQDAAVAECRHGSFTHKRTIRLLSNLELQIVDDLDGPAGEYLVEQFWHPGSAIQQLTGGQWRIGNSAVLTAENSVCEPGWRSTCFGSKEESPVVVVRQRLSLPVQIEARLQLSSASQDQSSDAS